MLDLISVQRYWFIWLCS